MLNVFTVAFYVVGGLSAENALVWLKDLELRNAESITVFNMLFSDTFHLMLLMVINH